MTIALLAFLAILVFYLMFFVLPKVAAAFIVSEIEARRRRR